MATIYTDIANTVNASLGVHERISDSRRSSGRDGTIFATRTLAGTETTDTIRVARCEPGKLYLPVNGFVLLETGGATSMSVKLGYEYDDDALTDDDDAFLLAAALTAGTKKELATGAKSLTGFSADGVGWITCTITAINTPVAAKLMLFYIPFVQAF